MAEEARLESAWPPKAAPGFESLSFRIKKDSRSGCLLFFYRFPMLFSAGKAYHLSRFSPFSCKVVAFLPGPCKVLAVFLPGPVYFGGTLQENAVFLTR